MIGVSATVRRSGKVLERLMSRATSPGAVLRQAAGYLKLEAQQKISSAEGFPPWAESTRKRYEQQGTGKITAAGNVRSSYARRLDVYLRRKGGDEARDQLRQLLTGPKLQAGAALDPSLERLRRGLARAEEQRKRGRRVNIGKRKAEKHTMLGQLVKTWAHRMTSRTSILLRNYAGFSGVQNDGGTVGNGAEVPSRKFLEITAEARRWIAQRVASYLVGE